MIIQELSSGEVKYTKGERLFSILGFTLFKTMTRYGSQTKWKTSYTLSTPIHLFYIWMKISK